MSDNQFKIGLKHCTVLSLNIRADSKLKSNRTFKLFIPTAEE